MKRVKKRSYAKALRREYVRDRGRSDRCWDNVYIGRRAFLNTKRVELRGAELEFRRSMNLTLWGPPGPSPVVEYVPPPGSRTRRVKLLTEGTEVDG